MVITNPKGSNGHQFFNWIFAGLLVFAYRLCLWRHFRRDDLLDLMIWLPHPPICIIDVMRGTADLTKTKQAFEAAAKEARVWVAYRSPWPIRFSKSRHRFGAATR
jgi:hypothetical protein